MRGPHLKLGRFIGVKAESTQGQRSGNRVRRNPLMRVIATLALCGISVASGIPFMSNQIASAVGSTPLRPTNFVGNCTQPMDSTGQISLTFTPGSDGGSPITNYEYSFDNVTFTAFNPATTTQPFVFDFTTYNRPLGQMTYVYLRAVNANGFGESSYGNPSGINSRGGCSIGTGLPSRPQTGMTATPGDGSATVTFTPSSNGGSPITNYKYSIDGVTYFELSPASATSPITIPGLTNGVLTTIYLKAHNVIGDSPTARTVQVTPASTSGAPVAPATPDLATASDSGSSSTDDITSDNTPTISVGSATNGNTVTVTATKSGQTNVTCTFTSTAQSGCDLGTLVDGVWSVTAKQTNSGIDSAATSALSITVDATPPTVTSFSSTKSDGTYGVGTTINITATLSEDVAVGASITVTLDTGDTVVLTRATDTTLTGTYTVGTGDSSADLTVTSYVLTSPPTDAAGNAMTSTALPTGANNIAGAQAIVIDTTAPTLSSAAANIAGTQVTLTFNEPLNATTAVAGDFAVSVGTTSITVSSISVSGSTVILTLGTSAATGDVISVVYTAPTPNSATSNSAIQDTAGNDAASFTTTATVPSASSPTTTVAPTPTPAVAAIPTTTTTTTVAPTPVVVPTTTVAPTKTSSPTVLECKTVTSNKKVAAPVLVGEKLSNGIIFDPASPALDSADRQELDRVANVMTKRGGLVLISGFARKNGFDSAEYLRNLSLSRARNVSDYLVAKGIRVSMRYEGYGAVTKDIGTSIERKVELRWIDDSEKIVYEKKCLNQ